MDGGSEIEEGAHDGVDGRLVGGAVAEADVDDVALNEGVALGGEVDCVPREEGNGEHEEGEEEVFFTKEV